MLIQSSIKGKSYRVLYGHLSIWNVEVGQQVSTGDPIGAVGATSSVGLYRNPHLHLEYRGLTYNECPAAGLQIRHGCYGFANCGSIAW